MIIYVCIFKKIVRVVSHFSLLYKRNWRENSKVLIVFFFKYYVQEVTIVHFENKESEPTFYSEQNSDKRIVTNTTQNTKHRGAVVALIVW